MSLATYKRDTRAHIANLQEKLTAAEARAELAERQVRDLVLANSKWRARAFEAEAALKSQGRARV